MQISSALSPISAQSPSTKNAPPSEAAATGPDKVKDKDKTAPAPGLPPEPPGGGLSMAAVWASQADRRAEEKAEAEAAEAKAKSVPATPPVATDGSDTALRVTQEAVRQGEANRAASEAAAEARAAEEAQEEDPFAAPRSDPFAFEPAAAKRPATLEPKPEPGVLAYRATLSGDPETSGTAVNARY